MAESSSVLADGGQLSAQRLSKEDAIYTSGS
jgi:hypothetical protein